MSSHIQKQMQEIESLIRLGRTREAGQLLAQIPVRRLARSARAPLADLCRRTGRVTLGLKLLASTMSASRLGRTKATDQETAVYAALLLRTGAVDEAIRTLSTVDSSQAPEASLYKAFGLFARWDYETAIPHVQEYLKFITDPYARGLGEVNLAAAFVGAYRHKEAAALLDGLIPRLEEKRFDRLLGNCYQIRSTAGLEAGDFAAAERDLLAAENLVRSDATFDSFRTLKWRSILESRRTNSTGALANFRAEAFKRREWESVRDADFQMIRIDFNQTTFEKLYFGTPFPSYRETMCRVLDHACDRDSFIVGSNTGVVIDLVDGKLECDLGDKRDGAEVPGRKMLLALAAMVADAYRPASLGHLFSEIFPGEYYDVWSSPNRVHQILRRTRRWLEMQNVPISLGETDGAYRIEIGPGVGLRLPPMRPPKDSGELVIGHLQKIYRGGELFSAREAREKLTLPETTFRRHLRWAESRGLVKKVGRGDSVCYCLVA
jgi:tetratricopeptide (TPR) repeat protein